MIYSCDEAYFVLSGAPLIYLILILYNFRKTKPCVPLPNKDGLIELHLFIVDYKFLEHLNAMIISYRIFLHPVYNVQ